MADLEKYIKIIPGVVAVSFVCSIVYAYAYFSYVDVNWLSAFTLFDLFSHSWKLIPTLVLAVVVTPLLLPSAGKPVKTTAEVIEESKTLPAGKRLLRVTLSQWPFVFMAAGYWVIGMAAQFIPVHYAASISAISAVFLVATGFSILKSRDRISKNIRLALILTIGAFLLAFSTGFVSGASAITRTELDVLYLSDGSELKGHVLYTGERGVIVASHLGSESRLVRWEGIVSVARNPDQ